ncbi:hypothetical protein I308_103141 [Cryptococcus tetragattii IND107]|uniref:Uncharacterized protein n=1 Tax=Cryptococcus tetragattii IND107 TaxID=1296105 RepID=A0ABR3BST2_9TREE
MAYNSNHPRPYTLDYSPNEELEEFDVRADFDVKGPRWRNVRSSTIGLGVLGGDKNNSYRPVSEHIPPLGHTYSQDTRKSLASREELVSVPVLGPEWKKTELHDLSRRGQSGIKAEKRKRAWLEWRRDQRGLCGVRWLTRRVVVGASFLFCVALAVTLYFVIPRAPNFEFYHDQPFTVNNDTISFNRTPTNFSFSGNLNLWGDASSSYFPVHFAHLEASLYDETTNKKIATGDWGNHIMQHKTQQAVVLPVTFAYSAINTSDTTWNDWYNACGHIWPGTVRSDLKLKLLLKMSIVGLTKKPLTSTLISGVTCPFELSADNA